MGGATLPINAMLYCGASGNTLHKYEWQSNASGTLTTPDATEACKKVTVSALKKLKSDWGENIRIYVILFRKQDKYRHLTTLAETNFDYSYITNSTDVYKWYDVPDSGNFTESPTPAIAAVPNESAATTAEAKLNNVLARIAADIKKWAGYQEAKNVN